MSYKMMIVVRKDLNMRKGKMIAQGGHGVGGLLMSGSIPPDAMQGWRESGTAKIAVGIDSEEGLLDLTQRARAAKLPVNLVRDSGRTEFNGEPTYTVAAIGPARSEQLDPLTGDLKLL